MFPCSQQLKMADVNAEWLSYDVHTMFASSKSQLNIHTCVPKNMVGEVFFATKTFTANFATKRRIIGVRTHMICQVLFALVHAYVGTVVTAVSVLVVRRAELVVGITPAMVLAAVPEVEIVAVAVTAVALLAGVALLLLLSFGKALLVPAIELGIE
ncbi:hypothetical protein GQX74_001628 [Glossina fuscipes]|nr:hypothetical protein GQX74_001628 [Glossina fuscipes]